MGPTALIVSIGVRPGGSSSRTLTSRSPYTVIAAVRGIGVAVITRTSGTASPALSRRAARCSTPKRCCSSIDDDAEAMEVDRRLDQGVRADHHVDGAGGEIGEQLLAGGAGDLVGEQLDAQRAIAEQVVGVGDGEVGEELARTDSRCCSARTSVGAIRAPWLPDCTAASSAVTATTVLPEPTSPWSRRCIGRGDGEVGVDLADDSALGRRQVVRQGGVEALHELAADLVREADRVRLDLPLAADEHELDAQQLVERQAPAGLVLGVDASPGGGSTAAPCLGRRGAGACGCRPAAGRRCPRLGSGRGRSRPSRRAPTSTAGPSRSAGRSARSARCGRRSGRRSGSSSAGRCGTGRRCRTGRR